MLREAHFLLLEWIYYSWKNLVNFLFTFIRNINFTKLKLIEI